MKIIKILIWVIVCIVLLAGGLVIAITQFVDPNDYKDEITAEIKKQTGRDLVLDGDLEISFYPWLGLSTGALSLSQRPGFGDQPMIEVSRARVKAKLLPLLKKEIEIDKVLLEQPRIRLHINDQGLTNWGDLAGDKPSDSSTATTTSSDAAAEAGVGIAGLAINGVEIKDGLVEWKDDTAGTAYTVSELQLLTGTIEPNKPVDASVSFAASGDGLPAELKGSLDLQIEADLDAQIATIRNVKALSSAVGLSAELTSPEINVNLSDQHIKTTAIDFKGAFQEYSGEGQLKALDFKIDAQSLNINGASLKGKFENYAGEATLGDVQVALSGPKLSIENVDLSGGFDDYTGRAKTEKVDLDLAAGKLQTAALTLNGVYEDYSPAADISQLAFDLNKQALRLGDTSVNAVVNGESASLTLAGAELDLSEQTVVLPDFSLSHPQVDLKGNLTGSEILAQPKLAGKIDAPSIKLRELLDGFKIDIGDIPSDVLQKLDIATTFKTDLNSVQLSDLDMHVDDSRLRGELAVNDFTAPAYRFNLKVDQLNIDKYLPATDENADSQTAGSASDTQTESASTATTSGNNASPSFVLPVTVLEGIDVNGELDVDQLITSGVSMKDVVLKVSVAEGRAEISPLKALLYKGSAEINTTYDVSSGMPKVTLNNSFKNIDVAALLTAAEVTDQFGGRGELDIDLKSQGVDDKAIRQSMNGALGIIFRDGYIVGVDIRKIILQARSVLDKVEGKETKVDANAEDKTEFSEMSASFNIVDGVAKNDDLAIKAPLFRITGKGSADLAQETLNYRLTVNVVNTSRGQGGKDLADLEGVAIPLRIKGPFLAPEYYVDVAALLKARLDREVEKEKDKLKEKLGKKLEKKLGLDAGALNDQLGIGSKSKEKGSASDKQATEQEAATEETNVKEDLEKKLEDKKKELKDKLKNKLFKSLGG